MDWGFAEKLGLETELLVKPIKAKSLKGEELFSITHTSTPLQLHIIEHIEHMRFYLFKSSSHALILGQPWLFRHNPHVNWRTGEIMGWGQTVWEFVLPHQPRGRIWWGLTLSLLISKQTPSTRA